MAVHEQHATEPSPLPRSRAADDVSLSLFLLLLLATTVFAWPLREAGAEGLLRILRLLTLVAGLAAIAPQRLLAVVAALAALLAGYEQLAGVEHDPWLHASRIGFFCLVGGGLLVQVFRPGRINLHRLLGAVAVYVLLAVIWGNAFQLLVALRPEALRGVSGAASDDEAMWLSFITLTTTGYGDVLPVSPVARSLAALEAMVGVLYPAILISRVVSLVQGARGPATG